MLVFCNPMHSMRSVHSPCLKTATFSSERGPVFPLGPRSRRSRPDRSRDEDPRSASKVSFGSASLTLGGTGFKSFCPKGKGQLFGCTFPGTKKSQIQIYVVSSFSPVFSTLKIGLFLFGATSTRLFSWRITVVQAHLPEIRAEGGLSVVKSESCPIPRSNTAPMTSPPLRERICYCATAS